MDSLVESVFGFFDEICKIPRESGNEKQISDFLVSFAKERSLRFVRDKNNNVIIFKNNSYNKEPIILQAHMDMVCVKTKESNVNFKTDGIKIVKKKGYLCAENTSLGADNGIGIAIILAILDSDLPVDIEAVFTVEEETTCLGAMTVDLSLLKSNKLVCLDGFSENTVTISTAGFVDFLVKFDNKEKQISNKENCYELTICGLKGGHSGFDIDKNRGSSHKLMSQFLLGLGDCKVCSFEGGHNFNVIPSSTNAVVFLGKGLSDIRAAAKKFIEENKTVYKGLKLKIKKIESLDGKYLSNGQNLLNFVENLKDGVIKKDEKGFNLASFCLSEIDSKLGVLKIGIRFSTDLEKENIVEDLKAYCRRFGFLGEVLSFQPAFNSFDNSSLVGDLLRSNKKAKVDKLHITTECGFFQLRKKDLDVAIISPRIKNAHSVDEKVKIDTICSTVNWLKKFFIIK